MESQNFWKWLKQELKKRLTIKTLIGFFSHPPFEQTAGISIGVSGLLWLSLGIIGILPCIGQIIVGVLMALHAEYREQEIFG